MKAEAPILVLPPNVAGGGALPAPARIDFRRTSHLVAAALRRIFIGRASAETSAPGRHICTAEPSLAGDASRVRTLRALGSVAGGPLDAAGPSLAGGGAVRVAPTPFPTASLAGLTGGRR